MIAQRASAATPVEPLVAGAVHGVRAWRLEGDRISAWMQGPCWESGGRPTRARCLSGSGHSAPAAACGCGLHGFHPWSPLARRAFAGATGGARVVGLVEAWGELEVHADGFRAELARPLAFFLPAQADAERRARIFGLAAAHEARVVVLEPDADLVRTCAAIGPACLDEGFVRALVSEAEERPDQPGPGERLAAAADWLGFATGLAVVLAVWGLIALEAISLAVDLLRD